MHFTRTLTAQGARLAEQGRLPDAFVRWGIRRLLARRAAAVDPGTPAGRREALERFLAETRDAVLAPVPEKANEQHYELPPAFFDLCLGRHRKYSCAYWDDGVHDLDTAEQRALELTCAHAELADGQDVLELGCGWGSLSLFMAERYPRSRIVAVSNSALQRESITARARERGLTNLRIVTCDMNDFAIEQRFDRVVSVEMFEHMRNWHELLRRIRGWLHPGGRLFVHVFAHAHVPYVYQDQGPSDWLGHHFFSGGIMPSFDQLAHYPESMQLAQSWRWNGRHYARTAEAWLENLDAHRDAALELLRARYGADRAKIWLQRWRIFFMACAELWGYRGGEEWLVGHYLLRPR